MTYIRPNNVEGIAILPLAGASLLPTPLVLDGFESPAIGGLVSQPAADLPLWDTASGLLLQGEALWPAAEGVQHIELSSADASLSRAVDLEAGKKYRLGFSLAGDVGEARNYGLSATINGQSGEYWFDSSGMSAANVGWSTRSLVFTATSTSATLTFDRIDGGTSGNGPLLDAVTLLEYSPAYEEVDLSLTNDGLTLSWSNGWLLEESNDLVNWTEVVLATSPFTPPSHPTVGVTCWRLCKPE